MSECENLFLAHSLAQSIDLTEYDVMGYAPLTDPVLATAGPSIAAVEWEEAAKSSEIRHSLLHPSHPMEAGTGRLLARAARLKLCLVLK